MAGKKKKDVGRQNSMLYFTFFRPLLLWIQTVTFGRLGGLYESQIDMNFRVNCFEDGSNHRSVPAVEREVVSVQKQQRLLKSSAGFFKKKPLLVVNTPVAHQQRLSTPEDDEPIRRRHLRRNALGVDDVLGRPGQWSRPILLGQSFSTFESRYNFFLWKNLEVMPPADNVKN